MSDPSYASDAHDDVTLQSRFTYRHLRLLGQSSVTSPLRVIALVDFDCFYAQCEAVRLGLSESQPLGVQQFKHVIAINYAARAAGLKKVVTAIEAKEKCPDIVLQHVPTWREGDMTWAYRDDVHLYMDSDKSSLDYYRLQSRRAMEVIKNVLPVDSPQKIEKAGIDEAFLDLSAHVYRILLQRYPELTNTPHGDLDSALPRPLSELLDWDDDRLVGTEEQREESRVTDWDDIALHVASEVVRELRLQIHRQLRYTCSAGIARNKILAKLAAGHNKPNKQTVVRDSCIPLFLSKYKATKIRGLGGKLGEKVTKKFKSDMIADLLPISLRQMQSELGFESGQWVYRAIRGHEYGEVVSRTQIKSMLSAKTFTPSINGLEQADRWLHIFAADIMGRMADQEGRRPRTIAVHHQINGRFGPTKSKQASIPLGSKLDLQCLQTLSRNLLIDITNEGSSWPCQTLSVSVSDFFDTDTTSRSILSFLGATPPIRDGQTQRPLLITGSKAHGRESRPKKRTILDFQSNVTSSITAEAISNGNSSLSRSSKKARDLDQLDSLERDNEGVLLPRGEAGEYVCPTCAEPIPAAGVLEHLDWHVALSLQNER